MTVACSSYHDKNTLTKSRDIGDGTQSGIPTIYQSNFWFISISSIVTLFGISSSFSAILHLKVVGMFWIILIAEPSHSASLLTTLNTRVKLTQRYTAQNLTVWAVIVTYWRHYNRRSVIQIWSPFDVISDHRRGRFGARFTSHAITFTGEREFPPRIFLKKMVLSECILGHLRPLFGSERSPTRRTVAIGCQSPTLDTNYRSRVGDSALNPSLVNIMLETSTLLTVDTNPSKHNTFV